MGHERRTLSRSLAHYVRGRLPNCELTNVYGSTEVTADATFYRVLGAETHAIPIGRPIPNMRIYILDGRLQPVPIGVSGEIYVGGVGVARGYLNRPDLTDERFLPSPFVAGDRFRTGDLGRYLADGNIEYLGRNDFLVKIRGFRIELGEIEATLAQHPGVREAVVLAREDEPGEKRLAAYYTAQADAEGFDARTLRAHLSSSLPDYMVPSAYVRLAALPLTPNGKLDRKALPRPDANQSNASEIALMLTETQKALSDIWRHALELEGVGLHDNFFELGGHSLLAVRVIAEINKTLNMGVSVPQFFQNPTIDELATSLESERRVLGKPRPRVLLLQPGQAGPVYFLQAGPAENRIAKFMGRDRAVFGTDVPLPMAWRRALTSANQAAWPTVEQLGSLHGEAIRAHAGTSPCVVAGYSFHGKVVIEAARALQRAGGHLATVFLIEFARLDRARPRNERNFAVYLARRCKRSG